MKSGLLIAGLVCLSTLAQAEVKPANAVLAHYCGMPNRSEQVCIGSTQDGTSHYIIKRVMSGEPLYIKAEVQVLNPGPLPRSSRVVYRGTLVERSEMGYRVENRYELLFSSTGMSESNHAVLRVNDSSDTTGYGGFKMEPVFHTQ